MDGVIVLPKGLLADTLLAAVGVGFLIGVVAMAVAVDEVARDRRAHALALELERMELERLHAEILATVERPPTPEASPEPPRKKKGDG